LCYKALCYDLLNVKSPLIGLLKHFNKTYTYVYKKPPTYLYRSAFSLSFLFKQDPRQAKLTAQNNGTIIAKS